MQKLIAWAVALSVVGGVCGVASAQEAQDVGEMRIGYVDLGRIFDGYERTQTSKATLERQAERKKKDLEGRIKELQKMREGIELLSDEAREARGRKVEERVDELQRLRTNAGRDLRREEDRASGEIFQDIQTAINDFAKANGFAIILDDRSLLYGQNGFDVSGDIITMLNERYKGR